MSTPSPELKYAWELLRMYVETYEEFVDNVGKGRPFGEQPNWTELHNAMTQAQQRLLQFGRKHVILGYMICPRCCDREHKIISKPKEEFFRDEDGNKKHNWCKECIRQYGKDRYWKRKVNGRQ
jgi:hypothetical protein